MGLPRPNYIDADEMIELFERAADTLLRSPLRRGSTVHLPPRGRLLATGDIHDFPGHLEAIVRLAELDASSDHHVMLHELIHGERLVDRMDMSYRNLAVVAQLVVAFPLQVHPLLANHELAQCHRMAVSKGGGDQVAMFDDGLEYVFGERAEEVATAIREFILALPLVLRADNGLWCAHSIPGRYDFDDGAFDRQLEEADYRSPKGTAWTVVWGRTQDPDHVRTLLARLRAKLFVVGHCLVEMGAASPTDGLVVLNSDHERGAVVYIALDQPLPSADELVKQAIPLVLHRPLL
ncbi:MAG: metallophosphoesterase [Planctomycetota bacterium]